MHNLDVRLIQVQYTYLEPIGYLDLARNVSLADVKTRIVALNTCKTHIQIDVYLVYNCHDALTTYVVTPILRQLFQM